MKSAFAVLDRWVSPDFVGVHDSVTRLESLKILDADPRQARR